MPAPEAKSIPALSSSTSTLRLLGKNKYPSLPGVMVYLPFSRPLNLYLPFTEVLMMSDASPDSSITTPCTASPFTFPLIEFLQELIPHKRTKAPHSRAAIIKTRIDIFIFSQTMPSCLWKTKTFESCIPFHALQNTATKQVRPKQIRIQFLRE